MPDSPAPSILTQVYWHAPTLWPIAALTAVALVAVVYLLYPPQLGAVPWPWRGVLPALRLAAVLALVASVLKPVARRRLATAEERGAVLVLVDRSRSMAVVDNARTPAQLVALADALGKLKPGVRSDAATALAADMERLRTYAADVRGAQDDLDYARVSGRDIQVRQTRLQEVALRFTANASALAGKAGALPAAEELTAPAVETGPSARLRVARRMARDGSEADRRCGERSRSLPGDLGRPPLSSRPGCEATLRRNRQAFAVFTGGAGAAPARRDRGQRPQEGGGDRRRPGRGGHTAGTDSRRRPGGRARRDARWTAERPDRRHRCRRGAAACFCGGLAFGRHAGGGDKTIVSGPTPSGVPIFTVNAAAALPPLDLSFKSVSVPRSVQRRAGDRRQGRAAQRLF